MGKVIAGMTMSLDGYINDKNGSIDMLYSDFSEMHDVSSFQGTIKKTGAVVMGKRAFEMGGKNPDAWVDYEFQTPIFVLTHTPPENIPHETEKLKFKFVTDGIDSAISQAKKAAGNKDVQVIGGASTIQQLLNAELCDELNLDIVPVLLGEGLRLFENIDTDKIKLKKNKIVEVTPVRTGLILEVIK